ncbi:MAG: histidine phosphatase family protein [Deltaproteobacteria bacterium]|nr:histidine phosphatase family protein [Deltaproteobacteria bacterium]
MIEVVLVRHAQPDWEPGGLAVDHPLLSTHGREQAQALAEALAGERFDAGYTSTLGRAIETAAPVGERLGIEFERCSWLDELRLPTLEGRTAEEVAQFFARARARDLEQWWDGMPPGGESFRHLYERVSGGVEALLSASHGMRIHSNSGFRLWRPPQEDRRLLVVAHEGSISVILSRLLDVEPVSWAFVRFSSYWAAITRLVTVPIADAYAFSLRAFNEIEHLRPLGLPPGGRRG